MSRAGAAPRRWPVALAVIAHGSRDPRHRATVRALVRRVRAQRPGLRVAAGFLDHCAPGAVRTLERLYDEGVRSAVVLPLLITQAFHAGTDCPALLRECAARRPDLSLRQSRVLGPHPLLIAALERRLAQTGVTAGDRSKTGIVLATAGSCDPEANADVAAIAREWRHTGWCAVRPAFASTAPPGTADAVRSLRADGIRQVVVSPCFVAPGMLADRVAREASSADLLAPVLGDAPEIAALVLHRYDEARAGRPAGSGQGLSSGPRGPGLVRTRGPRSAVGHA
ncbi:sirohydrochlorin chelatase [Streptomyces sp. NPDC087901]|uniref:sirohydrochlorin chelatase n=1 Tax=Streptomyces sp. NPDC087901 TaxID=3365818 RepID=UPI00380B0191